MASSLVYSRGGAVLYVRFPPSKIGERRLDDDERQNRHIVGFGNRGVAINFDFSHRREIAFRSRELLSQLLARFGALHHGEFRCHVKG